MTSGGSRAPAGAAPGTGAARPRVVQRLVAVPWRHPALIVVCALGGAVAAAALSQRHHADASAIAAQGPRAGSVASAPDGAAARVLHAPAPDGAAARILRAPAADDAAARVLHAPAADGVAARVLHAPAPDGVAAPVLQRLAAEPVHASDTASLARQGTGGALAPADAEALLQQAPPAANRIAAQAPETALLFARLRGGPMPGLGAVPGLGVIAGLAAGLSLGLLAAAARELRGERMRSVGEAEWALGAPVLGAVPSLSARSRRRLLAPAPRRGPAAPR